ncbi:MAG: NAD(P)H-dependent oxidoreductase [Coriobacteriia bacterium]|nr:NAD(P)H-dependent oxidoreductase [Coriobacteriia bacterium]
MNILVLNGSPKGKDSITLQTVEYLQVVFPEHEYEVLHVGRKIRSIEKDFSASREALEAAEVIVFCYPVYTFLVPAQLHRFIELVKESGIDLAGKWATQISTSKHFYDITAHRFIADNCADLGLRYIRGLSADMEDILAEQGRREAEEFFRFVMWSIERGFHEKAIGGHALGFDPIVATDDESDAANTADAACPHVALVSDFDPDSPSEALLAMIRRFQQAFPGECELINLREFPFAGGCLGCFNCASDGTCVYKDGFDVLLRERINGADAVVYAYTVRDHSMGYRFKLYDDRQFCNGHRTVTMGKPVAYLVDGKLSAEENLRVLMEARAQVGGNYLAGVASDEFDPDVQIDQLAATLAYAIGNHFTQPKNFYGVGGLKIFRDLIYEMQGLMKEDHRFYKEHGFYDFPQKKKRTIAGMYLVSALMNNKQLQKKSKMSMTDGMMMSYRKVIEEARTARGK